jgi:hypothetical protein
LQKALLVLLLLGALVTNACSHDTRDAGELAANYHPSVRYGALVSVDDDGHSVTLDIQRGLNPGADGLALDGETIRFSWDAPPDGYWDWFTENAKVGNTVRVMFHNPSNEALEKGGVPVMSIILDGYADVYQEYSRSAAQQEWEGLQGEDRK